MYPDFLYYIYIYISSPLPLSPLLPSPPLLSPPLSLTLSSPLLFSLTLYRIPKFLKNLFKKIVIQNTYYLLVNLVYTYSNLAIRIAILGSSNTQHQVLAI